MVGPSTEEEVGAQSQGSPELPFKGPVGQGWAETRTVGPQPLAATVGGTHSPWDPYMGQVG